VHTRGSSFQYCDSGRWEQNRKSLEKPRWVREATSNPAYEKENTIC